MRNHILLVFLLLVGSSSAFADRFKSLLNARHLTLQTQEGSTYYYVASSDQAATLRMVDGKVIVGRDTFLTNDIKALRIETIPRFVLSEDSATFGNRYTVGKGLLALKKTLNLNKWNSIVLPVELTGDQVRDAFGQDAMVAKVRGFREGSNAIVDYETVELDTGDAAMLANVHYLIRPTREPDLAEGQTAPLFGTVRPTGPLYLIPTVSMKAQNSPNIDFVRSADGTTKLMLNGTYTVKDGSTASNKKLMPGIYYLDGDGLFCHTSDSVALKAFSSWYTDIGTEHTQLHFYIDGIDEDLSGEFQGMEGLGRDEEKRYSGFVYDLQGRRLESSVFHSTSSIQKKGIYIINGKKTIVK